MALPSVGAVSRVTGKKALEATAQPFKNLAQSVTSPLKQLASPVTDVLKEASKMDGDAVKSTASSAGSVTATPAQGQGQPQVSFDTSGIESLLNTQNSLIETTNSLLQVLVDSQTAAAKERALALKLQREGMTKEAAAKKAAALNQGDAKKASIGLSKELDAPKEEKESTGPLAGIAKMAKFLITKVAFVGLVVLPALLGFFQSEAFTKIKEFAVDKWPSVKEFFGDMFGIIGDFFMDVSENVKELFNGDDRFLSEKIFDFGRKMLNDIGQAIISVFDSTINLVLDLFGVEGFEDPIRNSIKAIGRAIGDSFNALSDLGSKLYASLYESMPRLVQKVLPTPKGETMAEAAANDAAREEMADISELTPREKNQAVRKDLLRLKEQGIISEEKFREGIANLDARAAQLNTNAQVAKEMKGEQKAAKTGDVAKLSEDKATAPPVIINQQNNQDNKTISGQQIIQGGKGAAAPAGM